MREREEWRVCAHQTQPHDHGGPEGDVVERLLAADELGALQHDDGELQHLADEAVAAQFLGDAGHDDLVPHGGDEEGDDGGVGAADVRPRGAVDVAAQEAVDGYVPLAAELHPVGAVPPVAVEVPVGEAGDLGEGAQHVLEDDEEDEQEGQHEGEQQPRRRLGQDQERLEGPRGRVRVVEPCRRLLQRREDELLRDDGQQEDAPEDGGDLGDQVLPVDAVEPRVLDLVAQRGAEEEVDVVGPGQVRRVRDVAHGARQLPGEILPQLRELLLLLLAVGVLGVLAQYGARDGAARVLGGRVQVGRLAGGRLGVVEVVQALLGLAEVAVVEAVRVHLHEDDHGVQDQEDLRRPRPLQNERHRDPERHPPDLVYALDGHAPFCPGHGAPSLLFPDIYLQREDERGAGHHGEVDQAQVPPLDCKEGPDLDAEGPARLLEVAQHGRDAHDEQADPEEVEEAMEVAVVGIRVKVRHSARELYGREDPPPLLGAGLPSGARQDLD